MLETERPYTCFKQRKGLKFPVVERGIRLAERLGLSDPRGAGHVLHSCVFAAILLLGEMGTILFPRGRSG
jgi:hypothetical protein